MQYKLKHLTEQRLHLFLQVVRHLSACNNDKIQSFSFTSNDSKIQQDWILRLQLKITKGNKAFQAQNKTLQKKRKETVKEL